MAHPCHIEAVRDSELGRLKACVPSFWVLQRSFVLRSTVRFVISTTSPLPGGLRGSS